MVRTGNLFLLDTVFLRPLLYWMLLPLMLIGINVHAETEVHSTVDRNKMALGDTFTLTISVASDASISVQEPRLPDLEGFELLNTWTGSKTRSTFSNGQFQVERAKKFNYMLAPKKKGKLKIQRAEVVADGQRFFTKPITIDVVPATDIPRQAQRKDQQSPFDDPTDVDDIFSQLLRNRPNSGGFKTQPGNPKEAFFIQAEVDKESAYVGEQVTASWYLYTRGAIRDIDTLKYPSLNGFWKEDIEVATRLNFTSEVINGIPYQKALLASYALFPIKAGKSMVDAYKAKCTVITASQFGFGQPYQYTKSSHPVQIEVKALPPEGRPKEFNGAVGNFNVSASIDGDQVPVNQPIALKIKIEGRGNAKLIDLPSLELPPSIEVYDTQKDGQFFKDGTSVRNFEVLLIPREQGEVIIPAVTIAAFDPENGQYYTKPTQPIKLKIIPNKGGESLPSNRVDIAGDGKELPPKAILPLPVMRLSEPTWLSESTMQWLWPGVFLLLCSGLLFQMSREFGWGQKKRDLEKIVSDRLTSIYKRCDSGDWRSVGIEATNLVYFLFGELSGAGGASEQIDKLLMKTSPSVRREVAEPLKKLMQRFEVIAFAPEGVVGVMKEPKELKRLLKDLESVLRKALKLGVESKSS